MTDLKRIKTAFISVYDKNGLEGVVQELLGLNIEIVSTGGTKTYLEQLGARPVSVEELTGHPSILGGRVKTLHPKIFGGILFRRNLESDALQAREYGIGGIDLVVVDLYPFEETVASGANDEEITEKIDIGGISLIRAAAKNHNDVLVIPSRRHYGDLLNLLREGKGETTGAQRRRFAGKAFEVSAQYDTAIGNYISSGKREVFQVSVSGGKQLRYGENPHQEGFFFGRFDEIFDQLWGKEISYNNLLDIDAAVGIMDEFEETSFAILKHNNACGLATAGSLLEAWNRALAGDPVSAFGGILITNRPLGKPVAEEINKLFFEVIIAPAYDEQALEVLKQKKNRIILVLKEYQPAAKQFRSLLNGVMLQDRDNKTETRAECEVATERQPDKREWDDLLFANRVVKHTKSNAIVLAKDKQLIASGVGQTSRVDALKQAIDKAKHFNFDLGGAVMASDAFFPFADSVEIASKAGITAVIQPGGSIRDKDSVEFCNKSGMAMVITGVRHFKH